MANKKTVVQMYEELLAIPTLTAEQRTFLEKRIEITQKKNASGKGGEPTPKQLEKIAENEAIEASVLSAMEVNMVYTATDLVKRMGLANVTTTQKLTPRLTALVKAEKLTTATVKGRTVYSLPKAE